MHNDLFNPKDIFLYLLRKRLKGRLSKVKLLIAIKIPKIEIKKS